MLGRPVIGLGQRPGVIRFTRSGSMRCGHRVKGRKRLSFGPTLTFRDRLRSASIIAIGLLEHYINRCIFCACVHGACVRLVGLGFGCWWARVGGPASGGQWVR
jgi:hypothetical protein